MADSWGADGPPDEAYSRVSRDLRTLTADFATYLDALPGQLTAAYRCAIRAPEPHEQAQVHGNGVKPDEVYAVQPDEPRASGLVVARLRYDGGASVRLRAGLAIAEDIPICFCDACDEDSESLIAQTRDIVELTVNGFVEFRRPYRRDVSQILEDGPWMEHGYTRPDGSTGARASASTRGKAFSHEWAPWPRRQAS
jgi:hypothetical protein